MPCNAHGHPPTCECGWGGINHDPWRPSLSADWSKIGSHTNPNAKCPVCSMPVFFYRSPDGGAVFFDGLGPPWPKHPCTSRTIPSPVQGRIKKKKKTKNPWWPYPCWKVERLVNNEGVCLRGEQDKRLFIKTSPNKIPIHTPIWVSPRAAEPGKYNVSTFKLIEGSIKESLYIGYSAKGIKSLDGASHFPETNRLLVQGQEEHGNSPSPTKNA